MTFHRLKLQTQLALQAAVERAGRLFEHVDVASVRQLDVEGLEDRLLMSATPTAVIAVDTATAADVVDAPNAQVSLDQLLKQLEAQSQSSVTDEVAGDGSFKTQAASVGSSATTVTESRVQDVRELVFLDPNAPDVVRLIEDLNQQRSSGRSIDLVLLDDARDGVDQISDALAHYSGLEAVHIVSHGAEGEVWLGSTRLDLSLLGGYVGEFAQWGRSLSSDADLLFYGCKLAANDDGQWLMDAISVLTGADVAASTDITGHARLGGDWQLEFETGEVSAVVPFSPQTQADWLGTLATMSFQEGVNGYSGTVDTYVDRNSSSNSFGSDATVIVNEAGNSNEKQGLIRFDNLFGNSAGQIPQGATITGAELVVNVTDAAAGGDDFSLHRLEIGFTESSTWNSLSSGVQTDGIEAAVTPITTATNLTSTGAVTFSGLGSTVQSWANGAVNNGLLILKTAANSWAFSSSEATTASQRPQLIVHYNAPSVIRVDTTNDVLDGDTSSVEALLSARGSDGKISLREAISASNATSGTETIELTAGTYTLSLTGAPDDANVRGDLDITNSVRIVGVGTNAVIIDGGAIDRVLDVSSTANVEISNVTITNGKTTSGNGGGLRIGSTASVSLNRVTVASNQATDGGGIFNQGVLNVADSTLRNNTATTFGGGLSNVGVADIKSSTLHDNSAANGAGIAQTSSGATATLTNSTLTMNSTTTGGAAIHADGSVSIRSSTIAFNSGGSGAGGIHMTGVSSTASVQNSILAYNSGGNANRALNSAGHNIDSGLSAGFSDSTDHNNTDPRLGYLADNGGLTKTLALQGDSPAIGAGLAIGIATDQRGFGRGTASDIGAYQRLTKFVSTQEFHVNTTTTDVQSTDQETRNAPQSISVSPTGESVVVWGSNLQDSSAYGVYAQRLDRNGQKLGSEFRVNTTTNSMQYWAAVDHDDAGRFVVVWSSIGQDGSNHGVYARVFDANGSALTNEIQVNSTTTNNQKNAALAVATDGSFVVAWEGEGVGDTTGIFFRRFDAGGTALDISEIRANVAAASVEHRPAVAINTDKEFVVVWDDAEDVWAQKYRWDTTKVGVVTQIDGTHDNAHNAVVGMADDGSYVVAHETYAGTLVGEGIYAQRVSTLGDLEGTSILVNQNVLGDQIDPSIAVTSTGEFVVAYISYISGNEDVYLRQFGATGNVNGGEIRVNRTTAGVQADASVSLLDDGNLAIVWSGEGTGDTAGVFARFYGSESTASLVYSATAPTIDASVDSVWSTASSYNVGVLSTGAVSNSSDASATWKGIWTNAGLYLLVNVTDDVIFTDSDTNYGADDSIEVLIDGDQSRWSGYDGSNDYQFVFRPGDTTVRTGISSVAATTGITFTTTTTSSPGYRLEAVIPWALLGTTPDAGQTIGLDVSVNDDDDGGARDGKISWIDPFDQSFQNPLLFGTGELIGPTATNTQPIAVANGPYYVDQGATITLSAAGSIDSDGVIAAYEWDFDFDGSTFDVDATGASPVFSAASLTAPLTQSIGLRVRDNNGGYSAVATTIVQVLDDQLVNTTTSNSQTRADIASNPDGRTIVVWEDPAADGSGSSILGQLYDSTGIRNGSEFVVTTTTSGSQSDPHVSMRDDGQFVVVWTSYGQAGDLTSEGNIYARRFAADGTPLGSEFGINQTTAGHQHEAAVAYEFDTNRFLVAWSSVGQDGSGSGIYARFMNADGSAASTEFLVNTTTAGDQSQPDVGGNAYGEFSIVWQSFGQDGSGWGIYEQRYKRTQSTHGNETIVNTTTSGDQYAPAVGMERDGDRFIVWTSDGQDGSGSGIYSDHILYGGSGSNNDGEQLVNTTTVGDQSAPAIALDDNGSAIVTWQSTGQDGDATNETNIFGQVYSLTAHRPVLNGSEFRINTFRLGNQAAPSVSAEFDGDFTAVWTGAGPGDGDGVFARHFSGVLSNGSPDIALSVASVSVTEGMSPQVLDAALVLSDSDSTNFTSAAVEFVDGFVSGEDVLSIGTQAGITTNFNALTGILTLTGTAPVADYQSLLRTVAYHNVSQNPNTASRLIHLVVSDGTADGGTSLIVNVAGVNDVPTTTGIANVAVQQDAPNTVIDLWSAFADFESADSALTFSVTANSNTSLFSAVSVDNATGTLTLDYQATAFGVANITVRATDPSGATVDASFQVAINRRPTANPGGPYNVNEQGWAALNGTLSSDSDGTISLYQWDFNYDGVTFNPTVTGSSPTFSASGIDGTSTRTLALQVTDNGGGVSAITTTTITIANLNPTANNDAYSVSAGGTLTTPNVLNNDTDPSPLDSLTVSSFSTVGTKGLVTNNNNGTFSYNPNGQFASLGAGQSTTDTFTYSISDGDGGTATATVTITVNGVNDAPVITSNGAGATAAISLTENTSAVTTVTVTDVDIPAQTLTYSISGGLDAARFSINSSGALSFVSAPDFEAPADSNADNVYQVTVRVSDGFLVDSQGISVTVTAIDEAPVIISNGGSDGATVLVAEGTTAVTTVTATDLDQPLQPLTFSITGGSDASRFTIDSKTGVLTFSSPPSATAPTDSNSDNTYNLTVRVSDGTLADTQDLAVTVTQSGQLIVDTVNDVLDGDTSSVTALLANRGADGHISLREAVIATNNTAGADSILLPGGVYTLALTANEASNSPNAAANDFDITDALQINGVGSGASIIDANSVHRAFQITGAVSVTMRDLSIRNGLTDSASGLGGGIFMQDATLDLQRVALINNVATYGGGGITNEGGTLTMTDVLIANNSADGYGGGLQVSSGGTATMNRGAIVNNHSNDQGGGVYIYSGGSVALTNVTISGNSAVTKGGGINTRRDTTLQNVTLANNSASVGAGIFQENGPAFLVTATNSIIANNTGGNSNKPLTSGTYNIDSDGTAGLTGAGNQNNVNPLLGALQNNGGLTPTHALLTGSPALNSGTTNGAPTVDQRGVVRDSNPDIGAFELISTPPTITSNGGGNSATISVVENSSAVTTVTATDTDLPTQALTYSINGGIDAGRFSINTTTGELTFATAPDFDAPADADANNVYDVSVQVSDGTFIDTQSLTVTVTGINDSTPVINSNGGGATASVSVAENSTAVTTVTATDADLPAQTLTYSISGGTDAGRFAINSATGALAFQSAPNYETPADVNADNVYEVIVRVSDGSLTGTQTISVTVTPVNESAPNINSNGGGATASVSVAENSTAVTTVSATDADLPTQTLTYSISGGTDAGRFSINGSTGALSFLSAPNYEAPTDSNADNVYNVIVQASDGSLTDTQAIAVSVSPVNDNNPVITSNGGGATATVSVVENSMAVTTVTATDADLPTQTLTYSISGTDAAQFSINSSTGALSFVGAPNFEAPTDSNADNNYVVTVAVSDGTRTDVQALSVTVSNANDIAPVITAGQTFSVIENANLGASLGFVAATDADGATTFSNWTITGGNSSGVFGIDASTGELLVMNPAALNAVVTPTYTLTLTVSDGMQASNPQTVLVIVVAQLNNAPVITSNGGGATAAVSVAENSTAVTTVTASDADLPTQTLTYSISGGTDAVQFAINSSTGALSFVTAPDFEAPTDANADNVYEVIVRASDGSLTDTQTLNVSVNPLNDSDPVITSNGGATAIVLSVNENQVAVTTVTATDADLPTQTLTYSIVGGFDASEFTINVTTGELRYISVFDFEAPTDDNLTNRYYVTVQVSDGTRTVLQDIRVDVIDLNEAPTMDPGTSSIAENSANGTLVGTATASDVDAFDTQSFSILSGNSNGAFAIDPLTGEITVANSAALNFEVTPTFNLVLRVTDSGGLTSDATTTISLTNQNEAPTMNSATFSLPENSASDTIVGVVSSSDPDTGDTRTYSIISGSTAFAIDSNTGSIKVTDSSVLNFETTPSFDLVIEVRDAGGLTSTAKTTINLSNVNEEPTAKSATFTLAENASSGTAVGTMTATDPDAGDSLTYAIISGNVNGAFALHWTRRLSVANATARDIQRTATFALRGQVSDGKLSRTATATINLSNVNEAPTMTTGNFSVIENAANGTVIGTVTASDPDAGDVLSYAIVSGNSNGAFAINAATGELSVANGGLLDFETTPNVSLVIRATDAGNLSNDATTTISLTNVNEAPTMQTGAFSIAENAAIGTVVGSVSGTDPDASDSLSYSIVGGNSNGAFAINAATGKLTVANSAALDFESSPTFSLMIRATDAGGLTNDATTTIVLSNVNEAPTMQTAAFSIAENAANGTVIGSVSGTDPDASDSLSYSIIGNTNGAFAINSTTGTLSVANTAALNFEATPSFSLVIRVTDASGLTSDATTAISVSNVNEAPTMTSGSFSITENATNGTLVGTVTGTDPDPSTTLSYSIIGGNPSGAFGINAATGAITVSNSAALDFETTPLFNLVIRATDAGGLFDDTTTTIAVSTVNEAPTIIGNSFTIAENAMANTVVGTVISSDPDANDAPRYAIVSGNLNGAFAIHATTGQLSVANAAAIDFETTPSFALVIRVTDQGLLSSDAVVNVTVTDIAEPPVAVADNYVVTGSRFFVSAQQGLLANDHDPDAGAMTVTLITAPTTGTVTLHADGSFEFDGGTNFFGSTSFTYEVTDGVSSAQATVTLHGLIAPPPPPSASANSEASSPTNSDSTSSDSMSSPSSDSTANTSSATDGGSPAPTSPFGGAPTGNNSDIDGDDAKPGPSAFAPPSSSDSASTSDDKKNGEEVLGIGATLLRKVDDSINSSDRTTSLGDLNRDGRAGQFLDDALSTSLVADLRYGGEDLSYLADASFLKALDNVEQSSSDDGHETVITEWATGGAIVTSTGLSVGYIIWLIRGGYVLASVVSTMPVWQNVDPLPVLDALDHEDEDEESLESMITQAEGQN